MPDVTPANSVGLVSPQIICFKQSLLLQCGQVLAPFQLMVETYGTLNQQASNAVLVCHALSGNHHAAGYHSINDQKAGWWDNCIGPGKPIDTNHFFVVSLNNLGGCHGSTGPTSLNPETGEPWGASFPMVTVEDWVKSQALLADYFNIKVWAAVIGGSLGGMQALQWAISYPEQVKHTVVIASAAKLSAQNIAFNEVARQAIMTDASFTDGDYLAKKTTPGKGLGLARMIGHITYLSDDAMGKKFGRERRSEDLNFDFGAEFQVESYLHHQAQTFSKTFDANTYLLMTRALDYFDPAASFDDDLAKALSHCSSQFLVISFSTDWRFSPARSKEIVTALIDSGKNVSYLDIDAPQGHDAFLINIPRYINGLSTYMQRVARECTDGKG
ncbi:homoserine O-acetyltransferase [Endozoicomonas sp. Mp262]|uniref:homoserine O-succinyltransferase MetX n=1 Tax=Endozoicomonas sp. Mp262 TaxID=2919499 RepID=UPI0021DA745A